MSSRSTIKTIAWCSALSCQCALLSLFAAAQQPVPGSATSGPVPMPAPNRDPHYPAMVPGPGGGPVPTAVPYPAGSSPFAPTLTTLPKYLEGVITLDQLKAFFEFKQKVEERPEVKELTSKLQALELQKRQMQSQLREVRAKALADNPEMKDIADKMQTAMMRNTLMPPNMPQAHPGSGGPMPFPAGGPQAPQPMPQPTPNKP